MSFSIIKKERLNGSVFGYSLILKNKKGEFDFELEKYEVEGDLLLLRDEIEKFLGFDRLIERFGCSKQDAGIIVKKHVSEKICKFCRLKYIDCYECVFQWKDPIENHTFRKMKEYGFTDIQIKTELKSVVSEIEKVKQNIPECKNQVDAFKKSNRSCKFDGKLCFECVKVVESPLERILLLALANEGITPELQKQIYRDGSVHPYLNELDKRKILTKPDFFIEKREEDKYFKTTSSLCIYTDGFTYHERREEDATRDRNIDRDLQLLGFKVLRFTGLERREKLGFCIDKIKAAIIS
ncbi:MAG: hypothetical protein HUU10_13015 [Bacteroidetes bacterium]|nr:hypothetical protein [Bacteroidota bacterium]